MKKILKPFQINTILAKIYRIIEIITIDFMAEGNNNAIIATGNRISPRVACEEMKPPTHMLVVESVAKVKPIRR